MVPLCNFPQLDLKSVQQMKNLICRSSKMGRCVGKQLLPGSIFQICGGDGFLAVNQCLVGYVPVTRHESGEAPLKNCGGEGERKKNKKMGSERGTVKKKWLQCARIWTYKVCLARSLMGSPHFV